MSIEFNVIVTIYSSGEYILMFKKRNNPYKGDNLVEGKTESGEDIK